jgi:hypothetical protein
MTCFLLAAMHVIASRRGDALCPELVRLFERSEPSSEGDRAQSGSDFAMPDTGTADEGVLRFPVNPK